MLTWKDYQVSEARRKQLIEEAEARRQLAELPNEASGLRQWQRKVGVELGAWLIALGLRLQAQSADVVETIRIANAAQPVSMAKQVEQNC